MEAPAETKETTVTAERRNPPKEVRNKSLVAREPQVETVGAQLDLIAPVDRSPQAEGHGLEDARLVPE
jgi:hypothetical protein